MNAHKTSMNEILLNWLIGKNDNKRIWNQKHFYFKIFIICLYKQFKKNKRNDKFITFII